MYKALLGPRAAIYGDHVELTRIIHPDTPQAQQLGVDFASTLGTGGVLGTKFTLPQYSAKFPYTFLSPEKDAYWKKWIALYNDKMLSQGDFLDLYTYGYDFPEAYAIAKDGKMYYAFYTSNESPALNATQAAKNLWKGEVELRGLQAGTYKVVDYVNNRDLGTVQGPTAKLNVEFADSLLLEVTPLAASPGAGAKKLARINSREEGSFGGRDRDRTCDLMLAKHALSQLSYTPTAGLLQF